jgi:GMP synthase (glutamine-hydrolysing)
MERRLAGIDRRLMGTPRTRLRLVLLQIRDDRVSLLQEQSCFIERCRVARRQFDFINLVDAPQIRWHHVADAHAVLIGGAGSYSVTHHHPFTDPLTDLVERLIEAGRPVFGSCWGHQFLAEVFGGKVIEDQARAEVGTFPIRLTAAGVADPLFDGLPERFPVQLGHNDRVSEIGPIWQELAVSDLCPFQVIRYRDRPVYGTQFHSELDEVRLRDRLDMYRQSYAADDTTYEEIVRTLRPTVVADGIMARFLEVYA